MRRHFLADRVRDVDHRLDLLLRHLRRAGHAAEREHRARGNHLEQIRAVVEQELGALAELFGAARDAGVKALAVRRFLEIRDVQVAAALRNGEIRTARLHARPDGLAGVDHVAQRRVGAERIGADIAHAGEARQQGGGGVFLRQAQRFFGGPREIHGEIRGVLGPVGEMRVHVDEAGQAGVAGQIEHGNERGHRIAAAGAFLDALDPAVADRRPARRASRVSEMPSMSLPQRMAIEPLSGVNGTCRTAQAVGLAWVAYRRRRRASR